MSKRQLLLLSSSNFHGHEYLQFAKDWIVNFLKKWVSFCVQMSDEFIWWNHCRKNVDRVLFIPYASAKPNSYDEYTEKVRKPLRSWGFEVTGIHESPNAVEAVKQAQAIFIGGGNTFLLLKTLYDKHLVEAIRSRVIDDGVPYIGSSVSKREVPTVNRIIKETF